MKTFFGLVALSLLTPFTTPALAAEATGEWWEMTMKVEMPGMPAGMAGMMGGQTSKLCMLKGQEKEPAKSKENKDCTMSDLKYSGNTTSFKMKCTGKNAMTGDAVLTHTPNSFSQKMNMQTKNGNMTMVSNGKRIGGACKGDEQLNEALGGTAKAMDEQCQKALNENNYGAFVKSKDKGMIAVKDNCKNMPSAESRKNCEAAYDFGCAKLRPQMCARLSADLKTQESYKKVYNKQGSAELASECGLSLATITQQYCKDNVSKKDWRFVGDFCRKEPEVVALRKQHCAGRDYTTVDSRYRDMCSAIGFGGGASRSSGNDDMQSRDGAGDAAPKEKPANQPKKPGETGLDALKKIFKF